MPHRNVLSFWSWLKVDYPRSNQIERPFSVVTRIWSSVSKEATSRYRCWQPFLSSNDPSTVSSVRCFSSPLLLLFSPLASLCFPSVMSASRIISSSIHRSHSDRDLPAFERRVTRTRLVSSSSSSNLQTYGYAGTNSSSSARKMSTNSQLPWDQLQKWLYGIAIVTFDLEIGHTIESVIPSHCTLTEKDRANLSFLAFPDTNSNCSGDIQYHFRLDHQSTLPSYYQQYNAVVPAALQVEQNSLFGYVNFRQVRDKTVKRGYFQKSVVILSKLPFFSLFNTLSRQLAVHFFQNGLESLESCCYSMNSLWPELEPGKTLVLPVLDQVLRVRIPTQGEKPFAWADLIRSRSNLHESSTVNTSNYIFKFPIDDDAEMDLPVSHPESEVISRVFRSVFSSLPLVTLLADQRWRVSRTSNERRPTKSMPDTICARCEYLSIVIGCFNTYTTTMGISSTQWAHRCAGQFSFDMFRNSASAR